VDCNVVPRHVADRALEVSAVGMSVEDDVRTIFPIGVGSRSLPRHVQIPSGSPWRDQVNWDEVRERTRDSPFANAYFTLLEDLEIASA
jgi:hypothetical protein